MIRIPIKLPRSVLILIALIWLFVAGNLLGLWPSGSSEEKWKTLTHDLYGFSVDYPTTWRIEEGGEYGIKGSDILKLWMHRSLLGPYISFYIWLQSNPDDIEDYMEDFESIINSFRPLE